MDSEGLLGVGCGKGVTLPTEEGIFHLKWHFGRYFLSRKMFNFLPEVVIWWTLKS